MKILQNQVECLECGDFIYSAHRHDFKTCSCGNVSVDGGMSYLKRSYKEDGKGYKERSVSITDELYDKCISNIDWAIQSKRNSLGILCAVFKAIEAEGYKVTKSE